ncbi:MAG: CGNR zinc finger domain-containing protein [Sphingomonas sp.]|uniref:CGNR zinc finger domain-containing protein n=1 Tax=Sphingomonas sp. TaxID=28214 RepID=UPI001B0087C4|nr:ABATE domain-containing protein [Sphingomonas sp.]MBO9623733.1 CGNR zinc finger domain-containing protein [Sphingomonas sp.]
MIDNGPMAPLAEDRDGFRFRGGNAALDLAATLQARLTPAPRELLVAPGDLDRWLVSAGLVKASPGATDADLTDARALREAIFMLAGGLHGRERDADARSVLNRIAAAPAAVPVLGAEGGVALEGSVAGLLSFLAREAVHLFGGEQAAHIRQCQSPTCTIYFVDTSRSGDRRWCSMSACGNKAKVAEFRRRKRASPPDA